MGGKCGQEVSVIPSRYTDRSNLLDKIANLCLCVPPFLYHPHTN